MQFQGFVGCAVDSGLSLKVMEITMRLDIGNDPFGNPMKRELED